MRWTTTPLPLMGSGGEQPDAAPTAIEPPRVRRLRNARIVGPGAVRQETDLLLADTVVNAPAGIDAHAVCGIFPFTQQGGATDPSAGVVFSFDSDNNVIRLHQVDEDRIIMREITAYSSYTEALPPQITGFEMFGKFYFAEFAEEATANRKGLAVFDPAGAGTVTIPTYDLVAGGAAAAALRFRGITKHRGATILGWGYRNEETGGVEAPEALRFSKFGAPDTWVPDTDPTSAGFINVGTLGLPIIACAASGQFTVIGKETEIYVLDGDFSANFYLRQIGIAHGPVSTVGMVSIGDAAVWVTREGVAISYRGSEVQLLAIDRVTRRFLSYMQLTAAWGVHDSARHRVLWGVRRKEDDDGVPVVSEFLTELFWWDYERNAFGARSLPVPIFSLGTIRGTGLEYTGPTGVVSSITAMVVDPNGASVAWISAEGPAEGVTFRVEYKESVASIWENEDSVFHTNRLAYLGVLDSEQGTPPQLVPNTTYDVRVAKIKNGQLGAFVTETALFTTPLIGA